MAKEKQIPKLSDDVTVKAAQKKLTGLEQKLEQAINRPSQAIEDDIRERAKAVLDGTKLQTKREPDEIELLREVVRLATGCLNTAEVKAAERIIAEITPDYKKVRAELLTESLRLREALDVHDSFIQQLWAAGLSNFLPASWSAKAPVAGFFPHGKLDLLIENLRLAT